MDELQQALGRWWRDGDRTAGNAVIRMLEAEWAPRVSAFLRAGPDQVEEALQELVVRALFVEGGGPPKVLAPDHVISPPAWRTTVLKRMLLDRHRSGVRAESRKDRLEAEAGASDGTVVVAGRVPDPYEQALAARRAAELRAAMSTIRSVRRRVAVGMAVGFDMRHELAGLAVDLGVPEDELSARWPAGPFDADVAFRLLYPGGSAVDGDTFRKLLKRAEQELAQVVQAAA